MDIGIDGKLWRVIRNLYEVVESCVLLGDSCTDWFPIDIGLRQGDPLSCILYIIFIDGLVRELKSAVEGMRIGDATVPLLLFADDIGLVACSKREMQKLLDIVHQYSRKWRFLFNVKKCKVVVFTTKRKADNKPLHLGSERLEETNTYRYLGVEFKSNLSWVLMRERVVRRARSRLALISKAIVSGLEVALKVWHNGLPNFTVRHRSLGFNALG